MTDRGETLYPVVWLLPLNNYLPVMKTLCALCLAILSCSAFAAESNPALCNSLRDRLQGIESAQRQPQSGQAQDMLSQQKREVTEELKKNGCRSF